MTIDFSKRENVLALFNGNLEAARARLEEPQGLDVHVCVAKDYQMGLVLCEDGDTLRLTALAGRCDNLLTFKSMVDAQRARAHWNSRLSDKQREAGCELRACTLRRALEHHVISMGNIINQLEGSTH